jgi:hypothetical protein
MKDVIFFDDTEVLNHLKTQYSSDFYQVKHSTPIIYRRQLPMGVVVLCEGTIQLVGSRGKKELINSMAVIGLQHMLKNKQVPWDCIVSAGSKILLLVDRFAVGLIQKQI